MTMRTTTTKVTFGRRFVLDSSNEVLPPGTYDVETDEELLENVSFPVFRRVLTLLHLHPKAGVQRTLTVDPADLDAALLRDQAAEGSPDDAGDESDALKSLTARRRADIDRRAADRSGHRAPDGTMSAAPGQPEIGSPHVISKR